MRILELGSYIAPAYAGLILSQQGHRVTKLVGEHEPTLELRSGEELFEWLNQGKKLLSGDIRELDFSEYDAVIDNIRVSTWLRLGMAPEDLAFEHFLKWASLRSETGEPSFDLIAQNQAWGDKGRLPFYIGDTAAGLWLAFKLLNLEAGEHATVYQATALAKLVEGNLAVPWRLWDDFGEYYAAQDGTAVVRYRDRLYLEPIRDDEWRRVNLKHDEYGNYLV